VYFHYCLYGFSNCYILGTDIAPDNSQRDCIIVDPGCMDEKILRFIETNSYAVRGILVTHDHQNHVHGIRTLKKIYDTEIYGINHIVCDHRTNIVRDGDSIPIEARPVPTAPPYKRRRSGLNYSPCPATTPFCPDTVRLPPWKPNGSSMWA
jgi:glyoxylase-like metal-dependent hydrolase (beta-lactamase superfamily II)